MPIRNPFRKSVNGIEVRAEHQTKRCQPDSGFLPANLVGSKPIKVKEYKLSEINDSGVYLPPSPPENKGSWRNRSNVSISSSNRRRSLLNENEPFNISRESFDSYRRSFDISARSPIPTEMEFRSRHSLDSRQAQIPRQYHQKQSVDGSKLANEDVFEEVGLNDDSKHTKRGILALFGDAKDSKSLKDSSESVVTTSSDGRLSVGHYGFLFPGRRYGQISQGSELRNIRSPASTQAGEVAVESR